jgi:hypothetical protein
LDNTIRIQSKSKLAGMEQHVQAQIVQAVELHVASPSFSSKIGPVKRSNIQ